jgi:glyoxylase-like metal-dependent hydrolase (beta-lactamase superfamily II)
MTWEAVLPGCWRFRDSCNVYALDAGESIVIVDAGTGAWLAHVHELPGAVRTVLCTHYFRDHSAGAAEAARRGIDVLVPETEREFFVDAPERFRRRETYIIYDNLWDLFAPIESIPAAGVLRDYEKLQIGRLELEVLPLPGASYGQIGLAVTLAGRRIVLCAETIHSPGRAARVAPYQYNYNGLPGAVCMYGSLRELRRRGCDALLPSLGEPILSDTDAAMAALQENLRELCRNRPMELSLIEQFDRPQLERVTDSVWRATQSMSINWFLRSRSGKLLCIDYGYHALYPFPMYSHSTSRRPLLHSMEGLKHELGTDQIDVVLVSHFHDDHVCGIPVLQRVQGTRCWAAETCSISRQRTASRATGRGRFASIAASACASG